VRAVLDVNVLISALLSKHSAPGRLVAAWLGGVFELVISEALLAELERALAYPKLRRLVAVDDADAFVVLLRSTGTIRVEATHLDPVSRDPGDDYLVALARGSHSLLVTGDDDLLALASSLPIESPASFLARLEVKQSSE
jgi:putative PIN family toxin of toxin-antitoxin system